ncbi:Sortase family protein [Corynebacterium ciconiae DSM 44920]|uniref:class C sortase n=1 Tax=Corynebacterium ciconiae TaxID=227319 RepID=UPI000379D663|nr:class C sortase [Corynebacterium ciconiae]WKD62019.1 Sortase family protein [Corynebacterium ciconiae DSM 44920]
MTTIVNSDAPTPKQVNAGLVRRRLVPLIIILLGIAILSYPVVATYLANSKQSSAAQAYSQTIVDNTTQEERDEAIRRAHEWNENHAGGPVLDPWLARVDKSNLEYQEYLSQLDLADVMGRIVIPKIKSDLPVYHGTDEETLNRGIGHLYGSSLPVGGESTHAVLTGHTGLSHATLWDNLTDVEKGDGIYLSVAGQKMKYEVTDINVVLPNETDLLKPEAGADKLTLITCTPYGVNSHRLLVTGHRVPLDDEEADQILEQSYTPWQWWMTLVAVIVAAVLIATFVWFMKQRRRASEQGE